MPQFLERGLSEKSERVAPTDDHGVLMRIEDIIFVLCLTYSLSALVRYLSAANQLSLEKKQREESELMRKKRLDSLYGREN